MGEGIGVGFEKAMAEVSDDMRRAIPTDFDANIQITRRNRTIGLVSV